MPTTGPAATRPSNTIRCLLLSLLGLLCSACAHAPQHPATRIDPVVSKKTETLPPNKVQALLDQQSIAYHLGPGDVVAVQVYIHPDLSLPPPGVSTGSKGPPGAVISNSGDLQLALLGKLHVAGMTVGDLHDRLVHDYSHYLKDPSIIVQVQEPRSLRYYLLGEFEKPGVEYSDRPLDLLQVLSLGSGIKFSTADLRGAYVLQNGQKLPLDFHSLLVNGDLTQNVRLRSGDTVVVPSSANMRAYVFGAVAKPGPVQFVNGRLTLEQALADASMDVTSLTNAKLSNVHVLRSKGSHGEYIVIDAQRILDGEAAPFLLQSGDIVYVPQTLVSHWNQILQQLLPSLQTVSSTLQPFVQIKFLKQ